MENPLHPRRPRGASEPLFAVIAILYVLLPLVMEFTTYPFLGYRAAPNETFSREKHAVLQTRRVCKLDECDDLPDVWRDKRTSEIFRRTDFFEHRRSQARRLGWSWFAYSLIGGFVFALYTTRADHSRTPQAVITCLCVASAISLMIYFEINP